MAQWCSVSHRWVWLPGQNILCSILVLQWSAWVLSGYSGFLPQNKNRVTGHSKLPVCECGWLLVSTCQPWTCNLSRLCPANLRPRSSSLWPCTVDGLCLCCCDSEWLLVEGGGQVKTTNEYEEKAWTNTKGKANCVAATVGTHPARKVPVATRTQQNKVSSDSSVSGTAVGFW